MRQGGYDIGGGWRSGSLFGGIKPRSFLSLRRRAELHPATTSPKLGAALWSAYLPATTARFLVWQRSGKSENFKSCHGNARWCESGDRMQAACCRTPVV